jgi:hypothetical protein
LLVLALLLPIVGAAVLRILLPRLSPRQLALGAVLVFGVAMGSVLALARSDISTLRLGGITLLLPASEAPVQGLPELPLEPPSAPPTVPAPTR